MEFFFSITSSRRIVILFSWHWQHLLFITYSIINHPRSRQQWMSKNRRRTWQTIEIQHLTPDRCSILFSINKSIFLFCIRVISKKECLTNLISFIILLFRCLCHKNTHVITGIRSFIFFYRWRKRRKLVDRIERNSICMYEKSLTQFPRNSYYYIVATEAIYIMTPR